MAKKVSVFIILLLIIACTQKPAEKPQYQEYKGILVVVGNEPFTSFALDDGQGHITMLNSDKSMESKLNNLQGRMVRVYGLPLPEEKSIQLKSIEIYRKKAE